MTSTGRREDTDVLTITEKPHVYKSQYSSSSEMFVSLKINNNMTVDSLPFLRKAVLYTTQQVK